jgi:predicted ATPase
MLALRLGKEVSREWLASTLWPDSEPEQASYNLRRGLADLRNAFGVHAYRLPTLLVPPEEGVDEYKDIPALLEYSGIRFFVERAQMAASQFRLTRQNASAVIRICRHLDGVPLALELAAARMRALTAQEIAERLEDRFALLTSGSSQKVPRHQSLRADRLVLRSPAPLRTDPASPPFGLRT